VSLGGATAERACCEQHEHYSEGQERAVEVAAAGAGLGDGAAGIVTAAALAP
jgi:hypothetical protein